MNTPQSGQVLTAEGVGQGSSASPIPTERGEGVAAYRKRPVVIEAVQWTGANLREVICFTDGPPQTRTVHAGMKWDEYEGLVAREGLRIFTLEDGPAAQAKHYADRGDWIIKGVAGEFYPCKPDIFAATYELATPSLTEAQEAGEVERLRAALKHYACSCEPGFCAMSVEGDEHPVDDGLCGRTAAAALSKSSDSIGGK